MKNWRVHKINADFDSIYDLSEHIILRCMQRGRDIHKYVYLTDNTMARVRYLRETF